MDAFNQAIQEYTDKCEDKEALIGVHCTNGINRAGYLICRFLIERLGWSSHEAIDAFEQARGYSIEKGAYVMSLHKAAKDSRNKKPEYDSDSSERHRKKKNKRKHREEDDIHMINAILGELGQQTQVPGVSNIYQSSPNESGTPDSSQQQQHWGFAIKVIKMLFDGKLTFEFQRSKYAQLNQPAVMNNGSNTPQEQTGAFEDDEEEDFEEDFEEAEENDVEAGKGQSVSSKRRARRQRMQKCLKVMARGKFHEIQAMREEVAMTHGSARN